MFGSRASHRIAQLSRKPGVRGDEYRGGEKRRDVHACHVRGSVIKEISCASRSCEAINSMNPRPSRKAARAVNTRRHSFRHPPDIGRDEREVCARRIEARRRTAQERWEQQHRTDRSEAPQWSFPTNRSVHATAARRAASAPKAHEPSERGRRRRNSVSISIAVDAHLRLSNANLRNVRRRTSEGAPFVISKSKTPSKLFRTPASNADGAISHAASRGQRTGRGRRRRHRFPRLTRRLHRSTRLRPQRAKCIPGER